MSNLPPGPAEDAKARIVEACAHLDATAHLIEAGHTDDPFHPDLALAGQVSLLAAAIQPGIHATHDPGDLWDASGHLDHALELLDSLPPPNLTDQLRRCRTHLALLRDAIEQADAHNQQNRTPR